MSIALAVLILLTWLIVTRIYGTVSIPGAGLLGLTAYSLPGVLGFYTPPSLSTLGGIVTYPTTDLAVSQVILAWAVVLLTLVIVAPLVRNRGRMQAVPLRPPGAFEQRALLLLVAASLTLYAAISLLDSPLFFLSARQTENIAFGEGKILWRWVNAFGLILAVSMRSRLAFLFGAFALMYFIAGDRTMVAITALAAGVFFFSGIPVRRLVVRPALLTFGALVALLTLMGKPIYLAIKAGSLEPVTSTVQGDFGRSLINSFEPFLVHTHLEMVTHSGLVYPLSEVVGGALAQFLIVPSLLGVDSGRFNVILTQEFYSAFSFGLAFNYWAEGYAVGRAAGVVVFAVLFALMIAAAQRYFLKSQRVGRVMFVLIGVLIGVYAHRNSLENLFAFVRQIGLVGVPVMLGAHLLTLPRRNAASSRSRLREWKS